MTRVELSPAGGLYRAGNLIIRQATQADDAALRQILRDNPMRGWLHLALERNPSYFAGEDLFGKSRAIIGEDSAREGRRIGMYHTAFPTLFVNGGETRAGYLGALRINQAYRHSLRTLKHGFASIRPLTRPESEQVQIWFTSIASDNHTARRLLESGNPNLPRYRPAGELQTLAISVRHGRPPGLLTQATPEDIPALCAFHNRQAASNQFAPPLKPHWLGTEAKSKGLGIEDFWLLREGNELEACIAVWDQRAFKQAVVEGYRFPLGHFRQAYNLFARLGGRVLLPRPGQRLESVYLAFLACSSRAEKLVPEIVREALYIARGKQARIGLIGLAKRHALLPALVARFRPTVYETCIETVTWDDASPFELDDRPVQPEIAML